jgi:hypothetical protein
MQGVRRDMCIGFVPRDDVAVPPHPSGLGKCHWFKEKAINSFVDGLIPRSSLSTGHYIGRWLSIIDDTITTRTANVPGKVVDFVLREIFIVRNPDLSIYCFVAGFHN